MQNPVATISQTLLNAAIFLLIICLPLSNSTVLIISIQRAKSLNFFYGMLALLAVAVIGFLLKISNCQYHSEQGSKSALNCYSRDKGRNENNYRNIRKGKQTPMKQVYRFAPLFLITITATVFIQTFFNDFQLGWDDQWQVLEYEFVTNNSFSDLLYHFTHYHLGQYMPVNTLLNIVIYKLFGFNPAAFHAASLIIHVINVLLIFSIIKIIIASIKPTWTEQRIQLFSFFTAIIFAIHPLQVESVAWISASKIVLYSLFTLLGIRFYLQY
jgi:hypothetical protein